MPTKTTKLTKLPKPVKPLNPFMLEFGEREGHYSNSDIEMKTFMWSGINPPVGWVSITLADDGFTSEVTVTNPEELEKIAKWLVKAAAWMRKSKETK